MALLRQRDEDSFGYLYDHYSAALLGVITAIVQDQETARDVLQDVFVNIWKKMDSYEPAKGRLFTWMINIARNAAIDKIRSRGYRDSLKNLAITDINEGASVGSVTMPQVADIGLKKLLTELRADHRELIDLSYFQGFTHEEIAKMMGIPLGTVKTRIRSALTYLRNKIT